MRNPPVLLPYTPALDGVRALAVSAVLAFHGGIAALRGGFLGVDAFFVLSGYLITTLLLAEQHRSGRIDLPRFWGRRVRRLLPALLLVIATVLVVGRRLLPPEELTALRGDALGALAYVANWRMSSRGGGYFAETASPSPLQHTWSLGIEEQFYLLWPLLVAALLTLGGRRGRGWLIGACLVLGTASATAAAVLFDPADPDRAYYGTDTRAVALLIGAALAVALAGRVPVPRSPVRLDPTPPGATPTGATPTGATPTGATATYRSSDGAVPTVTRRVSGALAAVGAVGTAALWLTADGTDPWLYHGGFVVAALAVAAVLAHAVLSPGSATARVLGVAPLTWLGRISYGVYLWHWPLFQWITADRTGLRGPALFTARCAVTLAVATASYLLLEQPLRRARWVRRPARTPMLAATGSAATVVAAVLLTAPPPVPPPPPIDLARALATPTAPPRRSTAAAPAPVDRAGRTPGDKPRISIFGDSVAWSLGTYLPEQDALDIATRGVQGCGIARLPDIRYIGLPHTNYPGCDTWDRRWRSAVKKDDPDVAVILLDRWELMDRRLGGRYRHVGDPDFDAYLRRELDLAIDVVTARGAHPVLLTAPYTRRAERPDGGLWPEDQPQRVDAWNALLRTAATRHHGTVLDLNRTVCPDGEFTWRVDDVRVRSDGLHFTPGGVRRVVAPWLLPQLARIAVRSPASGG